jgi:hypothetical protein
MTPKYTTQPGMPNPDSQAMCVTTAVRLVRLYGESIPTAKSIKANFGCSMATAYRWRAALRDSLRNPS